MNFHLERGKRQTNIRGGGETDKHKRGGDRQMEDGGRQINIRGGKRQTNIRGGEKTCKQKRREKDM